MKNFHHLGGSIGVPSGPGAGGQTATFGPSPNIAHPTAFGTSLKRNFF